MTIVTKPEMHRVWASGATASNVIDPDVSQLGKFAQGWQAEVPTFENFNFLQKLFTQSAAYLNQEGIAVHDSDTDYHAGSLVKGSDNVLYQARSDNGPSSTVIDPVTDTTYVWIPYTGFVSVTQFGADPSGTNDSSAAFQYAIDNFQLVLVPPGIYRINTSVKLRSNICILGVKGATEIRQYSDWLWEQNTPDLENVTISSFTFDFRSASSSRYAGVFKLGAYKNCLFEEFRMIRYDDQTIVDRSQVSASATINGVDNVHRNWSISACAHVDIAIGLEGYYYAHQGDGSTSVIATDIVWPEQNPGSVIVLKENTNRIFSELEYSTDYTVAYDGSNKLTVTLTTPATSSERIHIWPSQPRTDGNRRPFSNNTWENINCDYIFVRGHTVVRWVDAEEYLFCRMTAAANFVRLYDLNPYDSRNGQGGDFMSWYGCVLTYQSAFVTNADTLRGIHFGPGSIFNTSVNLKMDLFWRPVSQNRSIGYNDTEEVVLTGTVTTNGTTTVTGTGTKFTEELTLIGSVPDVVIIDGVKRGIASIDSDTQITLTSSAPTQTGIPISRFNFANVVSYDMHFAASGEGQSNSNTNGIARYVRGSASFGTGSATILNGDTFVTVNHRARRVPQLGEIMVTSHSNINGRSIQVSDITATSFRINVNSAAAADYNFGWKIELSEMN